MRKREGYKVDIFEHRDYRVFLNAWIESSLPKRGLLTRLAEAATIHKTTLSQIFRGSKELSLEQAYRISKHLGLNVKETEYLILLVNLSRAGSEELKEMFRAQVDAIQKKHQLLSSRVSRSRDLTKEERAVYYSNWIYSAVRNISAITGYQRPSAIAGRLKLDLQAINPILDFLIQTGLCLEDSGEIKPGPLMTHLEGSSPLVSRHHGNWRIKAMERHPLLSATDELAYTAPMTLSSADVKRIKTLLLDIVQETDKIVGPSKSEKLYCMCLDWFEVK